MDAWKEDFAEQEIGNSAESFKMFLLSQRDFFHSLIDQFQEIVVTQCKLTGVNPLSQEMTAGALSIKIDLLDAGDLRVVLTKHSSMLSTYSDEVALPGGKAEERDKDDKDTTKERISTHCKRRIIGCGYWFLHG